MKNLKLLFLFLSLAGIQSLQAANTQPVDQDVATIIKNTAPESENGHYWAWVEQVASLMQQGMVADGIKLRKDTTITIYGSGGMDNESGRICPNTASSTCAKIVISGLATFDGGGNLLDPVSGTLTDSKSSTFSVTVLSVTGAREVEDAVYTAEGRNVTLKVNTAK
ncbi:MAG: hypothetical protein H6564_00235 [Lewinellaceae bacterium]|nr:hypothetical protein [Lewinellaceae bacterium]